MTTKIITNKGYAPFITPCEKHKWEWVETDHTNKERTYECKECLVIMVKKY